MSLQSEELAYDTANIVYKRVGPTYDKWWMKEGYGQNYAWVVAEHSDYSVRLFFEFMDTGFCYVKVHFTNGAAYEDLIADSWNYAKESPEYPFEETCDHVRNFLDNFFEVGGGMDKLRAKYEKGNNMYDVDSYTERDGYVKNSRKSSRRPIKSGLSNTAKDVLQNMVIPVALGLGMNENFSTEQLNTLSTTDVDNAISNVRNYIEDAKSEYDDENYPYSADDVSALEEIEDLIYYRGVTGIKAELSSNDNLPSEVYYIVINGAKQYFTDYNRAKKMARELGVGSVYTEDDPDEIADLYEVGYIRNSRKPIKSGTSIKEYAGFKIDDSVKINSPKRGPYKNGKTGIVVGFYKRYDGEILISVQLDEGGLMDFSKDELENLGDSGYHITYLDSSRKPIKSANYNGFNLEARRSYGKGNGYFTTYPVWDTDLDTSIGAIEYHYAVENPYYVAWVYNDFGANKTGRTKAFDTEEECLEWIGEELASGTTARDKLLKYWEELGYDYKSKNLNNSRKPVKSDWKREAEFMNDRIRDDNLLYQVFKIEDEHFGGNFENPDNWDGTHIVYTIENGEITNTEIVDSFEDVIDDGNKYYLSANRDTGYRNTDYVLDRVALWQERNNRGITSSRKPVKSSFIVGKQDNGNKVYFCEDGQYYSENDYARPSIKIFNSKQEADKIAKRSKSGFVSPLEK